MRARTTLLAALAAAATVGGCACEKLPSTALTDCRQGAIVQGAVKTDILFVIDDSGSMTEEQSNLVTNISAFLDVLRTSPVANDFQIGVTSTSVTGTAGMSFGCSTNAAWAQGALVGTPAIMSGTDPALVTQFEARVGPGTPIDTGGSGKEMPLLAMKLALSEPLISGANAGFLRPGARLAVIILTDEDDNSETCPSNVANTNAKTHNDNGDGVDYKFTREDPVSGYLDFLRGPIGGEVRDVVVGVIAGVDATSKRPTCGFNVGGLTNNWGCGSSVNNTCVANTCGVHQVTNPAGSGLTMDVYCCGGTSGTACQNPAGTCAPYDKADRLVALVDAMPFGKTVLGSICDTSFAGSLQQIAGLIISPTVPISGEPADPALLVVSVQKPDGSTVPCAAGTDYVYAPASGSKPATVTFLDAGACRLDAGYQIKIDVICAG